MKERKQQEKKTSQPFPDILLCVIKNVSARTQKEKQARKTRTFITLMHN